MKKIFLVLFVVLILSIICVNATTVTRSFSSPANPNSDITITLTIANLGSDTYYLIDEKYPSGWTVKSASDSGDYATKSGHIFWSVMSGATSKTYTYVIHVNSQSGTFTGTYGSESQPETSILGQTQLTISGSPTPTPTPSPSEDEGFDYTWLIIGGIIFFGLIMFMNKK